MDLATPFTGLGQRSPAIDPVGEPPADAPAAERLRWLLTNRGPMRAPQLAAAASLPHSSMVSALLKHDIASGRVTCYRGVYEIEPAFDEIEREEIQAAIALLRRKGYTVTAPV